MNAELDSKLQEMGISVDAEFVPWSKSRNAAEKNPSLNWKVTLKQDGKVILTTDYMAGMGHCPFYKNHMSTKLTSGMTVWQMDEIRRECETGFPVMRAAIDSPLGLVRQDKKHPIMPDVKDVIYSLLMDSEVLEYSHFEEWAREFGYNADSRSDEKIYNACLKIGLQFRKLGESIIETLRELFQDY